MGYFKSCHKPQLTSPGQPGIGVCVHEQLHVEQFSYLGEVKYQDALEQDHVGWVDNQNVFKVAAGKTSYY